MRSNLVYNKHQKRSIGYKVFLKKLFIFAKKYATINLQLTKRQKISQ